jgi:nitrate/nitrite-specific signal transduction histidine kinase
MNSQSNKNIMIELANVLNAKSTVKPELKSYYEDVEGIVENQDLITSLNRNLNALIQSEKKLSFMISEVRSTVKKRI